MNVNVSKIFGVKLTIKLTHNEERQRAYRQINAKINKIEISEDLHERRTKNSTTKIRDGYKRFMVFLEKFINSRLECGKDCKRIITVMFFM